MIGRYGPDVLTQDLVRVSLLILLVGLLTRQGWMSGFALLLTAFGWFRMFSKNIGQRVQEQAKYLPFRRRITGPFRKWIARFRTRKTHRVFSCDRCGAQLKVPKGKGTVRIRCPQCGNRFEKRT